VTMYVPKKLQENFKLIEENHGDNILVMGAISCCGSRDFIISYFGDLEKTLFGHKYIIGEYNHVGLLAKCKNCGKEISLFNGFTDGYDNCALGLHDVLPLLNYNDFMCDKCKRNYFSIEICFEYQSREELEEIGIQEYENAFSWIWISVVCSSCKKKYEDLIDIETA